MPILAAPLVIPFAEAIGLSVAVLGMAKIGDEVNKYIEKYPDESIKILSTIVPNIGIGQIFANKEDSGDDEEVEVEEDTRSKKEIVLGELGKDKGNYSDKDAEGKYSSKRGRIIRALEDAGKVNPDREYNPEKKYQGYKRFLKKADGGAIGIEVLFEEKKPRKDFNTGGRATTQDFANALKSVSAGTTYQQQRQAKDYARQEASNLLSQTLRSGNQQGIQNLYNQFGFNTTAPGSQLFNRGTTSGTLNQITGLSAANRNRVLDQMANKMLNTTSYAAPDPFKKRMDELDAIKAENRRLVNEYTKNNPSTINPDPSLLGAGIAQLNTAGTTPSPPTPAYMDQTLLSQLTKLTPEQATLFDPFDQLSDLDQYNLSQAYPELQSQLRDSSYVSPYGLQGDQELFNRRYGIKDGGRVGLFMGGDPLTGQALQTYNSMKAYGFSDQEIANALQGQGLYTPGSTPVVEEPVTNTVQNIINQGGGDGPPNDPPKDPFGGLGYSSANFGLGANKDVMDYEADAYNVGRTLTGQLNKIGLGIFSALKNIPTPFNLARKAFENYKEQKAIEEAQKEAARLDAERATLDAAYGSGNKGADFTGGRYDGADSFSDYSADPTGYSGSSKDGGIMGYGGKSGTPKGLATMFTRKR